MSEKPDLTSMTVSLPASQKDYVREQATVTGCSKSNEYIRRLIHADQKAHEDEIFERKILEGLDSPGRTMSAADWTEFRGSLRKQLASRRKGH